MKKVAPDGTIAVLEEGTDSGYVVEGSSDCPDLGAGFGRAVFFNEVLEKGYTISLSYEAPVVSVE